MKHISGCTNSSWFISVYKFKHTSKYLIFLIPGFLCDKCNSLQALPIAPRADCTIADSNAVVCFAAVRPVVGMWERSLGPWPVPMEVKLFAASANVEQIQFSSTNNLTSPCCFELVCLCQVLSSISLLILMFPKTPKRLRFCQVPRELEQKDAREEQCKLLAPCQHPNSSHRGTQLQCCKPGLGSGLG